MGYRSSRININVGGPMKKLIAALVLMAVSTTVAFALGFDTRESAQPKEIQRQQEKVYEFKHYKPAMDREGLEVEVFSHPEYLTSSRIDNQVSRIDAQMANHDEAKVTLQARKDLLLSMKSEITRIEGE